MTGLPGAARRDAVPLLEDLPDPSGKSVLVRATFDRPLAADRRQPLAYARAQGLAATIEWLTARGARVTVCGTMETDDPVAVADRLGRIRDSINALVSKAPASGTVSFCSCSEDPDGVAELLEGRDLFVNDTLQDSSLPLPSLTVPASRLPSAAGRTLAHDLRILSPLFATPPRPFVAVLGGARSYERLHGLESLVLRADTVLLGGAMALPVLQAVGKQPSDGATDDFLAECRHVVGLSRRVRNQIVTPFDLVWRRADGSTTVAPADVRAGEEVVDIGPVTRVRFAESVRGAGVTLWAGALGQVEAPESATGTTELATSLAVSAPVVLGGDALVSALHASDLVPLSAEMLSATDAAIELLKYGDLPGLAALRRAPLARQTATSLAR
jgi:phosphoglycerate kinase